MLTVVGCPGDIRTVEDAVRAAGGKFADAELWQTDVSMRLTRPTHISEWEGVIYSDGKRYAAIVNGASMAGQLQSHLVINGDEEGWLRITESGVSRVLRFDPDEVVPKSVGPESFQLPGNLRSGNPLGMFLDPNRALRILSATYNLRLTRRTHVSGDPALGFTGTIKPDALALIDPEGYLAERNLPIQNVDVTVRLYDGAPRRIQFLDQGHGYFLIEYSGISVEPEVVDARFEFNPDGADVQNTAEFGSGGVAGVNEDHVLFAWDETERAYPQRR